jgi:putative ABC transport system ATP-binding protein
MAIFQELNDEGKTVVLITHELDISEHAKRVVAFRDGRIVSDVSVAKRRVAAPPVPAGGAPRSE